MVCKQMDSMNCLSLLYSCDLRREEIVSELTTNKITQLRQLKDLLIATNLVKNKENSVISLWKLTSLTLLESLYFCVGEIYVEDIDNLFIHLSNLTRLGLGELVRSRNDDWRLFKHLTNVFIRMIICHILLLCTISTNWQ